MNGDDIPDVLLMAGSTIQIYLGAGSATYSPPFSVGVGPGANSGTGSILVENLHSQPKWLDLPDIVVPDASGGVMVLVNLTR